MTKVELYDLLKRIDKQYWGKLGNMIHDPEFLNAWYEDLAQYDNELIVSLYGKYDDPSFPPTAKYFTANAEKELKALDAFYLECANEIFFFATEQVSELREIIAEIMANVPYQEKRVRIENIKERFRREHLDSKESFIEWVKE